MIIKLSITVGLKFEFTLFSQLKVPDLTSIEKNWFLLFEKNKSFLSVIMSDVYNEKADSYNKSLWVGNCQRSSPSSIFTALMSPRELLK